jgi:Putative restriction endonuclease
VVEVSETTLKQDQGQKLLAYQDAGIPEYWMVDVAARGSQDTPAQTKPKRFWCEILKGSVSCDNSRDDGTDLGTRSVQGTAL